MNLLDRYRRVRAATVAACAPLSPEDMLVQSMPDASPVKWHLAHTTWFFETFVLGNTSMASYAAFDPAFSYLFNSYYEAVGPRHPRAQRGLLTRPTAERVYRYRDHVDAAMADRLPNLPEHLRSVVELGLNHEQQHLELIYMDVKHAFAQNPLRPAYGALSPSSASTAPPLNWTEIPEGIHWLGHAGAGFAFDNEGPRHRVFLERFAIAGRSVTCGEFLAFMSDRGYERPELWLSDGWHARQTHGWQAPLYWERHDGCWMIFTLGGLRPLQEAEAVCHVSLYEADAFARWAGARLPTEAEWEIACPSAAIAHDQADAPVRLHPAPIMVADHWFGDVWEWTQSAYAPYPGFRPAEGALGEYNGKFMCNQLVLRGGSCLTPRSHLRSTYRNFFSPEARWQFTGLRLARSL